MALAFSLLLAACGSSGPSNTGGEPVRPYQGAVIADEPRAALLGRDVLLSGGNAVDAAVATYFGMAVMLPSSASIGGGGTCLVWDARTSRAEEVEFPALPAPSRAVAAVPGSARGMFALHARHGRTRWPQLLAGAEQMARFGTPISRAMANDLQLAWPVLVEDPVARGIFGRQVAPIPARIPAGRDAQRALLLQLFRPLAEGDTLTQTSLADFIAELRTDGGRDMNVGDTARRFAENARRTGVNLTVADLASGGAPLRAPLISETASGTLYLPAPPFVAGAIAGEMWALLAPTWRQAGDQRPARLAQASLLAHWDRERYARPNLTTSIAPGAILSAERLAELAGRMGGERVRPDQLTPRPVARAVNPGAAKLITADREGNVVACGYTLNGLFGLARMAGGVVLAAASTPTDNGTQWLVPAIGVRDRQVVFAAVGSGGAVAPSALVQVALAALAEGQPLDAAIAAPRIAYTGAPDQVTVEESGAALVTALRARGYTVNTAPPFGRVIGLNCPDGAARRPDRCAFLPDPRIAGFAVIAD